MAALALGLAFLPAGGPAAAEAPAPFDPASRAWDGLGGLVELAAAEGVTLRPAARLDPAATDPADAILVVAPEGALPVAGLVEFVRRGGRLAVADDTGAAAPLLAAFGVRIDPDPPPTRPLLRGRAELPLALPGPERWHPLLQGVEAVVANAPAAVEHERVRPLLGLGGCDGPGLPPCEGRPGLLLAGVVGAGRFVVVGDPSLFIENMLRFEGNRALAGNLLRYLAADGGTVWLATPRTRWVGQPDPEFESLPPLARLRRRLAELSGRPAPPWLLRLVGLSLLLGAVLLALSRARSQDPYRPELLLGQGGPAGGALGRLRFHLDHPGSLGIALQTWQRALRGTLAERLGSAPDDPPERLLAPLRERDPGLAERGVRLLRRIEAAVRRSERAPAEPPVGPRELATLVAEGRRLLDETAPARSSLPGSAGRPGGAGS